MTIQRITISVPEEVAGRIRKAAKDKPVSTWVTEIIGERLDDAEQQLQWEAFCRDVAPTRRDIRRADAIFKRLTRSPRRKRVA